MPSVTDLTAGTGWVISGLGLALGATLGAILGATLGAILGATLGAILGTTKLLARRAGTIVD
jgi:tetrahydromethanopterin S-methyltransferase subunit C